MFILSETQLAALTAAFNNSSSAHPVADFYLLLADYGEASGEVDPASILWLRGAAEVNADTGSQSDFIRGYNKSQYEARTGLTLSDAQMDEVSDEVGLQVFNAIVGGADASHTIPAVNILADNDAAPAAGTLFPGNMGGWAGNHLFLLLGYSGAFYSNVVEEGSSTYDAVAMIKFTDESFGAANWFDAFKQAWNYPAGLLTYGAGLAALDSFLIAAYGCIPQPQFAFSDRAFIRSFTNITVGLVADGDSLSGTESSDFIHGGGGDDTFFGSLGSDVLDGAEGRDIVDYSQLGEARLYTVTGDVQSTADYIGYVTGTGLTDILQASLFGIEEIRAGAADDILQVNGLSATLQSIDGGAHGATGDTIILSATAGLNINLTTEKLTDGTHSVDVKNFENVTGSGHNDTIIGNDGVNIIKGGIGHDSVIGGAGSDTLNGYTGADVLDGGQGADADLIIGDAGADKLVYWGGQDTFNGGSGNDYIDTTGAATDNLTLQLDKGFGHDVLSTNTNRVKDVLLSTIDKADVELIWNYTSTETQTTGTKFLVQMVGEAVIRIKSTGDTIYIPELRGYYDKNVNTQYIPFVGSVQVISYANDSMLNPFNIICQDGMIDWVYHLTDELNTFTSGTVSDEWKSALTDFQTERETEDDGQGADSDDLISGNDDNNNLNGGNGNDTVSGGGGNDLVNASGRGTDIYTGGSGSDALTFVSTTMGVTANLSLGTTSGAETENDTFSGFENLIGGRGNDSLTGDDNANEITGGAGNDTLDGGSGVDTLTGGLGNDVYLITSLADTLVEQAAEGTDRIETDISYTLTNEFEDLTLTGTSALSGTGNAAANVLTGNSAANHLFGLDGDDTLSSGGGSDTLAGGMGDDVYVISDLASTLVEEANEGTDLIVTDLTFILADTFENLTLTGAGNVAGTGNIAANILTGNSGANSLSGLTGNDTLYGNSGNDTLTGGAGADNMVGGAGNDTFDVDNLADTVVEITGQGTDLVQSSVNWTLSTYLENLTLTGSAAISGTGNIIANSLTGNAAANLISGLEGNDTIVASDGNDTLDGGAGNDTMTGGAGIDTAYFTGTAAAVVNLSATIAQNTVGYGIDTLLGIENVTSGEGNDSLTGDALANVLSGGAGNDSLFGGAGNDTLNGGAGVDQMTGGADNDSYVVDAAGDTIIEIAGGGTADAVTSGVTFTLAVEVENLTLSGTAAINGTGNAVANILTGNTGANVLTGLAGNDNLVGGAGNDTLDGGADNDTLNGGTGVDSMTGGAGNDIYVVGEAADKVIEVAAGGTDTVQSAISFTLGVDVENLTLLGTAAINGVGNASANTIVGNTAANTLLGGAGNDILNGGTGTDSLSGGVGNDTYIVDVATDIVVELANEGTDLVKTAVTHTLLANFENLTLLATTAINGTGNAVANVLTGGTGANILSGLAGNDTLAGGAGNDTMVGGTGADAFVFVGSGNGTDTISDFNELNGGAEEGDVLQINGALVGTFVYRGASAFTGGSNNSEARIAGNQVLVDANGDGVADITITLTGLTAATQLAATDFVFV